MSELTAIAVVVKDPQGLPLKGVIGTLKLSTLPQSLTFITNADGYVEANGVPFPFEGELQIGGAAVALDKAVAVSITQPNTTIRFGEAATNPQDIVLPAAIPFA